MDDSHIPLPGKVCARTTVWLLLPVAALVFGGTSCPTAAQQPTGAAAAPEEVVEEEDAWATAIELGFTSASGNQELTVLTSELTVGHNADQLYDAEVRLQARYGSSEGEIVAESYQGALNIGLRTFGRWSPFIFTMAERDRFQLLDLRLNSGAGAEYRLSTNGREATIGVAVLHSYEVLDRDSLPNAVPTSRARFRVAADGRLRLRDGVTLTNTTHFEPVASDLGDYLFSLDTALKVLLTRGLALSVGYEFDRDSRPPAESVEPNDHLVRAGIILEW